MWHSVAAAALALQVLAYVPAAAIASDTGFPEELALLQSVQQRHLEEKSQGCRVTDSSYPTGASRACAHQETGTTVVTSGSLNATGLTLDKGGAFLYFVGRKDAIQHLYRAGIDEINQAAANGKLPVEPHRGVALVGAEPDGLAVASNGRVFFPVCHGSDSKGIKTYGNFDSSHPALWGKTYAEDPSGSIWEKQASAEAMRALVIDETETYLYAVNCGKVANIFKFRLADETLVGKFTTPVPEAEVEGLRLGGPDTLFVAHSGGWSEVSREDGKCKQQAEGPGHLGGIFGDERGGVFHAPASDGQDGGYVYHKAPGSDSFMAIAGCGPLTNDVESSNPKFIGSTGLHMQFEALEDEDFIYAIAPGGSAGNIRLWQVEKSAQTGDRYQHAGFKGRLPTGVHHRHHLGGSSFKAENIVPDLVAGAKGIANMVNGIGRDHPAAMSGAKERLGERLREQGIHGGAPQENLMDKATHLQKAIKDALGPLWALRAKELKKGDVNEVLRHILENKALRQLLGKPALEEK